MIETSGGASLDRCCVTIAVNIFWHSFGVTAWSLRLRASPELPGWITKTALGCVLIRVFGLSVWR
jgi:hypothetical protein